MHTIDGGPLARRLGINIIEASAQRVVGTMPVEGNTQPYGLLNGGASVALAETLGSVLAAQAAGPGRTAVGIEINAAHLKAVKSGLVTGVATPISVGRTLAVLQIQISDEKSNLICTVRLTCLLRDLPKE